VAAISVRSRPSSIPKKNKVANVNESGGEVIPSKAIRDKGRKEGREEDTKIVSPISVWGGGAGNTRLESIEAAREREKKK